MPKSKYCFAPFPSSSVKSPLADLSMHILAGTDRIFEILEKHGVESYQLSRTLCDTIQNSVSIFGLGIPAEISCASTSSEEKSSQESTSPLKGVSISSCFVQKLPFVDRTNEASAPKNLETKSSSADNQKSADLCEKLEMLSSSVEGDKMNIATSKDDEMKINPKEEHKEKNKFEKVVHDLFKNSAEIGSVSFIRQAGFIGLEIDIDSDCTPDGSTPKKTVQKSSPSKKTGSPKKSEIELKSPSSSESPLTVDDKNPNVLELLAERLVSIFKYRKTYMEQIDNYFKELIRDAIDFHRTIDDIKYVVKTLPLDKEPYFYYEFLSLRQALIIKILEMSERAESLIKAVKQDSDVLGNCLNKMDIFEKHNVPPLSSKGASKQTVADLKKTESHLKEIFTNVDAMVILRDERRTTLLKFLSDFKWLVNHFVKFLIVTGILKNTLLDSSQIGTDK